MLISYIIKIQKETLNTANILKDVNVNPGVANKILKVQLIHPKVVSSCSHQSLYVPLLLHNRPIAGFGQVFSLIDKKPIAFFAEMHFQVFDTDGVAVGYIRNI
jgi:hypothetical protein